MNTQLTDIYEKEIYAKILFSIWNEPKTVYNIAKELTQKEIEYVIIMCPKCGEKNKFPLINKLKDSSSYNNVNLKNLEGIERFRKYIRKSQKCKKILFNKKRCRHPLLKYKINRKKIKGGIRKESVLQNVKDINYDFLFYSSPYKVRSFCSNIKRDYLKRLEEEGFIKIEHKEFSLCSINWNKLLNLILYEVVWKARTYLSENEINNTRFCCSMEFSQDLEETKKFALKFEKDKNKEFVKNIINSYNKYLIKIIKEFYIPHHLKYKNLNEFIEWITLSLGQWNPEKFKDRFVRQFNLKDNDNKYQDVFVLQKLCSDYKYKKESGHYKRMALNIFDEYS